MGRVSPSPSGLSLPALMQITILSKVNTRCLKADSPHSDPALHGERGGWWPVTLQLAAREGQIIQGNCILTIPAWEIIFLSEGWSWGIVSGGKLEVIHQQVSIRRGYKKWPGIIFLNVTRAWLSAVWSVNKYDKWFSGRVLAVTKHPRIFITK